MSQSLILAIDQGGQSSRVAVYSNTGEQLCCFSASCDTTITQQKNATATFIEQSGEQILLGIRDCLQKIHAELGDSIKQIHAAGFAGQGSSLLCWDANTGEALSPVLSWQDTRAQHILNAMPLSQAQVQRITGLRISAHYGASKIRWCLENNLTVANARANNVLRIGPIVSYLFWHLLNGTHQVDPGHAQRTLLWNLTTNNWDANLLDAFAIPRAVLPNCVYHNSKFGELSLGDISIPFVASARDQGASLFARGLPDANACYINIGTGAFIQRVSSTLSAPDGLLVSPLWLPEPQHITEVASPTCYLETGSTASTNNFYAWEATVNGAASAIDYIQQCTGLTINPSVINSALALEPAQPCYFLNAIGGLSAPYWRTDLSSEFSQNLSPHEKIIAWLESVIFQIVINVDVMASLGRAEKIYISGGLSNADALCQKIADLTKTTVHRGDNSDATLQGIAYLAGAMPNEWQPSLHDEIFQPQENTALLSRFTIWNKAMKKWLE